MVDKQRKLILGVVFLGIFWIKAATWISMPFLTLFLHEHTNLSLSNIGLIVGMQPLALCFGSMIGGYLSDKFKHQTIMLFSVITGGLVFLGFYCISEYLTNNIQICAFILFNLLNGFSASLFTPASNLVMDNLSINTEEKLKTLHVRYLVIHAGSILGPLAGAYAGIAANDQAFLITMVLYFIYAIILFVGMRKYVEPPKIYNNPEKIKFVQSLKVVLFNRWFVTLLVSLIAYNMLYIQLNSNLAVVINMNIENGVVFYSWMLSIGSIMAVICQPIMYVLVKNRNQRFILVWGYIIILVCSLFLAFLPIDKITIILFVICMTMSQIMIFPTIYVLVNMLFHDGHLGLAYGVIDFRYLGSAVGPLIGGLIVEEFSGNIFFVLISVLAIISLITYMPFALRTKI